MIVDEWSEMVPDSLRGEALYRKIAAKVIANVHLKPQIIPADSPPDIGFVVLWEDPITKKDVAFRYTLSWGHFRNSVPKGEDVEETLLGLRHKILSLNYYKGGMR